MKTEIATCTGDALGKGSFYHFDPDQLILVTDEAHPLFDPRALEKPDEALVQSMLRFGFKTSASIEVEVMKEGVVVVDGRRRVVAAREVKRRQVEAGDADNPRAVSLFKRQTVRRDDPEQRAPQG